MSLAHVDLHAVDPHTNGSQVVVVWLQAPLPSQVPVVFAVPLEHVAAPHAMDEPGKWHAVVSDPLQIALHEVSVPVAHAVRDPTGAPVTAVHVPLAAPLHDSHWPTQAVLQQAPSTHRPFPHSELEVQSWPTFFLQTPPAPVKSQREPLTQVLVVQHAPFVQ